MSYHARHHRRHRDLEFDRFYLDPLLPFRYHHSTHEFYPDEYSQQMVEDRMSKMESNTLIDFGNDRNTVQSISSSFPPTTTEQSFDKSVQGARKSDPVEPAPPALLLDLNVDIIDDDGPFSLKAQQQQRPFINPPPPTEISEMQTFLDNSAQSSGPQNHRRNTDYSSIINIEDKDNEEDDVKRLLISRSPSHNTNGSNVDNQTNCSDTGSSGKMLGHHEVQLHTSWLPIELYQHDNLGLKVTSGSVTISKDGNTNMIGISIGGGAPNCPCLYIVQVFDNTPAAKEGTLQSGDEITGVNNVSVKGKTKVEVAKMIQSIKNEVTISYNKLHADAAQGKSLDIILKKVKHRLVENMSSATADALGLSRAILCNDNLVKKLADLQRTEVMYKGLVEHTQRLLRAYLELLRVIKLFGETFAVIGAREPQPRASLAFTQFADYHRNIEKRGVDMVKKLKPILSDLGTYLHKAIPDTKLTIGKYADAKFEYLSFCLKVKEMDDEEFNYASVQEPLYRVETGNYEYRLVLRCRQEARARFAQLRSDVQVKLELLDNKHVQDVASQLQKLSKGLAEFYEETNQLTLENANLFPVEVDLTDNAFIYEKSFEILPPDADEGESLVDE